MWVEFDIHRIELFFNPSQSRILFLLLDNFNQAFCMVDHIIGDFHQIKSNISWISLLFHHIFIQKAFSIVHPQVRLIPRFLDVHLGSLELFLYGQIVRLQRFNERRFCIFQRFSILFELRCDFCLVLVQFILKFLILVIINLSIVQLFLLLLHALVHRDEDLGFQRNLVDDFLLLSVVVRFVFAEHHAIRTNPDLARHTNDFQRFAVLSTQAYALLSTLNGFFALFYLF